VARDVDLLNPRPLQPDELSGDPQELGERQSAGVGGGWRVGHGAVSRTSFRNGNVAVLRNHRLDGPWEKDRRAHWNTSAPVGESGQATSLVLLPEKPPGSRW